jgi:hypothetical protein
LTIYNNIQVTVKTQVQALTARFRTAKIAITGHNLGGALGTHAVIDIH